MTKMKPKQLQEYEARLIEKAKANTSRNEASIMVEEELTANLAAIVPFDVEQERLNKARAIIARSKRPGSTKPDGQLMLPGFNQPYDYEPDRLVSDDSGNIIENHRAPPRFKSAEVSRAQENVERAVEQLRRKSAENTHFQAWALDQALLGRPALDLTWGNCVAETSLRDAA
jgi:hypothetical protein